MANIAMNSIWCAEKFDIFRDGYRIPHRRGRQPLGGRQHTNHFFMEIIKEKSCECKLKRKPKQRWKLEWQLINFNTSVFSRVKDDIFVVEFISDYSLWSHNLGQISQGVRVLLFLWWHWTCSLALLSQCLLLILRGWPWGLFFDLSRTFRWHWIFCTKTLEEAQIN